MTVKLLMTWDILPNREQEYFEFVISDFLPEIKQLGIQAALNVAMASKEWQRLLDNLLNFVENFSYKIISARTGFQL